MDVRWWRNGPRIEPRWRWSTITGRVHKVTWCTLLFRPVGLALDSPARLYVSDTWNHAVRAVDRRTGEVTTFAGQPGQSGSEDGVGGAARFNEPRGLALDGDTLCGIPCREGEPL